jgi:hypothetical protein
MLIKEDEKIDHVDTARESKCHYDIYRTMSNTTREGDSVMEWCLAVCVMRPTKGINILFLVLMLCRFVEK